MTCDDNRCFIQFGRHVVVVARDGFVRPEDVEESKQLSTFTLYVVPADRFDTSVAKILDCIRSHTQTSRQSLLQKVRLLLRS